MDKSEMLNNEWSRLNHLAELDLDPIDLEKVFENFTKLASQISQTSLSLLNLLDVNTLWTISGFEGRVSASPIEHSICKYTILEDDYLEVKDLAHDKRFENIPLLKSHPSLKYYFGLPLKSNDGIAIGTLCVFDQEEKSLDKDRIALLKIITDEIMVKLEDLKTINNLRKEAVIAKEKQRAIAHALRNPIAGIIGLSDVLIDQFDEIDDEEAKEYIVLINESSKSVLESADQIILNKQKDVLDGSYLTLPILKKRLTFLYQPLLAIKNLQLEINANEAKDNIRFLKRKVFKICLNLLSDIIKKSATNEVIKIDLDVEVKVDYYALQWRLQSKQRSLEPNDEERLLFDFTKQLIENTGGNVVVDQDCIYQATIPIDRF